MPSFAAVAHSEELENAWRFVSETSTSYQDFLKLPMPEGCSHNELWRFFCVLRRISGTTIPVNVWVNVGANVGWICLPGKSESHLMQIRKKASSSSKYNDYIRRNGNDDYYLHSFIFCEARALAKLDGVPLNSTLLKEAWLHSLKPTEPLEQLAINFESVYHRASTFARRRFSRSLIEDVYEELCFGIPDDYMPTPSSRYDTSIYRPEVFSDESYVDETLDQILAIFKSDNVFHDDFLRYIEFLNFMWDIPLFPRFNHLVEYLMRKIYFTQRDNPLLSLVPFCHLVSKSEISFQEEQSEAYRATEQAIGTDEGLDSSIVFEGTIEIYHQHIDEIIDVVRRLEKEEAVIAATINDIEHLNHRQKRFLVSALRSKQLEIKILPYQKTFGVAYATARRDLFDLMEKGFLSLRKKGKAFVFQALPRSEWSL